MGLRVLLVDDDELVIRAMRRGLRDHDVIGLTDPVEARALIAAGERFDAIVSDLMMPVLTGAELYDEIARIAPEQAERVIFVTAGATTVDLQEFLRRCARPILEKPVDLDRLEEAIKSVSAQQTSSRTRR